ncbi:hypothetical protein ACFE04_000406 [Oxalis oulophora]
MTKIRPTTSSPTAKTKPPTSLPVVEVPIMHFPGTVEIPLSRSFHVGEVNVDQESSKEDEEEPCAPIRFIDTVKDTLYLRNASIFVESFVLAEDTLDLDLAYAHVKAVRKKEDIAHDLILWDGE